MFEIILHFGAFLVGAAIVISTLLSAVRTFVLPRSANDQLTRGVFQFSRMVFGLFIKRLDTYEQRDRLMAYFAPVTLLALPFVWIVVLLAGYTLLFWATDQPTLWKAFLSSGSAFFTLGFAQVDNLSPLGVILTYLAAIIGLGLIALLISYLPTMYSAFQRREQAVTMLEIWAGSPPSPVTFIIRAYQINQLEQMTTIWNDWRSWFADIEESHTSLGALSFFRSPNPRRSWVSAAATVLDTAALMDSTLDVTRRPEAQLCLRSGYLALREIARFFSIEFDPDPTPTDPISLTRSQFEIAYHQLREAGVPLKADLEQSWRDFAGWRVNYDKVLLALAGLAMVPGSYWLPEQPFTRLKPISYSRGFGASSRKGKA